MDTHATPNTGARLTQQAIEALIVRRLDALGHPPDLLDRQAVVALVVDADGSGRRLRSSLAATLFLASTEDAPQIDAGLVQRALASSTAATLPKPRAPILQTSKPRPTRLKASRFFLMAGLAVLALALANLVLRPPPGQPAPAEVQPFAAAPAKPPPAQAPAKQPASQAALIKPQPAPAAQPAAPPSLSPMPPPVVVRSLPVPEAASGADTALPPLPAGAPSAVVLLYPARDSGALNRLRAIALRLQGAGVAEIRAKPVHAPPPRRVISYFYNEDRPLADAIAKTLADSAWPKLSDNSLQPLLVLLPPGLPGRNPGTIEVQLP